MPKTAVKNNKSNEVKVLVNLLDVRGQKTKEFDLTDFFTPQELTSGFKKGFIHQIILTYNDNQRQATAKVKTRAEVRGGGRKPWRQKGTGRARQGSIRSPQWRHGGVVFGPTGEQNFFKNLTSNMKKKAVRFALQNIIKSNNLYIFEELPSFKSTREIAKILSNMPVLSKKLIILDKESLSLKNFIDNLDNVRAKGSNHINPSDLLRAHSVICTKSSLDSLLNRVKPTV